MTGPEKNHISREDFSAADWRDGRGVAGAVPHTGGSDQCNEASPYISRSRVAQRETQEETAGRTLGHKVLCLVSWVATGIFVFCFFF